MRTLFGSVSQTMKGRLQDVTIYNRHFYREFSFNRDWCNDEIQLEKCTINVDSKSILSKLG